MRFLILFTFLISNVLADDLPKIKNIVIHKDLKTYDNVIFLDQNDQKINIKDFNGNLILLNFWATWCEPCKEEMPSLDRLQNNSKLNNIKIFPINISQESLKKINDFFKDLNIEYLEPYYDAPTTLAKALSLRGVPTSIFFNTEGKEFARIIGSIDFDNLEFIEWLKNYN
jgi:thiol-disulfide isomerase/thioredoxin